MAPAPITARFATARVTWAPFPTSVSVSVTSGPITASAPMLVAPSSWVPGSTVVSWPMLTSTSTQVVAGSTMVTPARMCASQTRRLSSRPTAASCTRSLTPSVCQRSPSTWARTGWLPARAMAMTSVRYFSPCALSVPTWASASRSTSASKA